MLEAPKALEGSKTILDEISLKILRILSKDSSLPIVEIAKQIGISDATVHLRIKHLIADGNYQ